MKSCMSSSMIYNIKTSFDDYGFHIRNDFQTISCFFGLMLTFICT